jgi:serine/threonine protein kinase
MAESLGPGLTFAGCLIERVAGRGGMGVVFEATQLALKRPVALKAIAPTLATDPDFRARFERESHLTASLDHPNVIPVYDAGERDGTLYLVMRWVDGTDLGTLLERSGRLAPKRAIKLLAPVASALAAAHRRGLVHRDVKPGNVLIARADEGGEDGHVYLTDFGIARRTDTESLTRTGVFVGTVDYSAPERFQRGKGDAASDIYSFGCVLFEAVTGQIPYDRSTSISKIHAHMTEPVPSARALAPDVPEQLDAIIAKAMAKRPEDRYRSAVDLAAVLEQAAFALGGHGSDPAIAPTVAAPAPAPAPAPPPEPAPTAASPTVPTDDMATRIEPAPVAEAASSPAAAPAARPPRRSGSLTRWAMAAVVVSLIGVLIATFSDNPPAVGTTHASGSSSGAQGAAAVTIHGGGLKRGATIALAGLPGGISIGKRNVWTSVPASGQLIRWNINSGARATFKALGQPTALSAGFRALWVAQSGPNALAQFNGDAGTQVGTTKLPGSPVATVFDQNDSSAWVADKSGAISHVAVGGQLVGTAAHSDPAATSIAWGEGALWATNGAARGLVRVNLDNSGASTALAAGEHPAAVTLNRGVWIADANGHVTRFSPEPVVRTADLAVAPELDAIAAVDPSPSVWAMSKRNKAIYRITSTGTPAVTGTVTFAASPVALAVNANSVWVATDDHKVIEIQF